MDCSMPGFPVLHHLPEFVWSHIHWVSDAIQSSHPLSAPSAAFNLSQHQGFSKSQLFLSDGQSIGASALSSVLPMNMHMYIYTEKFTLQLGICRMLWLLRFLIRQRHITLKQKRKITKRKSSIMMHRNHHYWRKGVVGVLVWGCKYRHVCIKSGDCQRADFSSFTLGSQ